MQRVGLGAVRVAAAQRPHVGDDDALEGREGDQPSLELDDPAGVDPRREDGVEEVLVGVDPLVALVIGAPVGPLPVDRAAVALEPLGDLGRLVSARARRAPSRGTGGPAAGSRARRRAARPRRGGSGPSPSRTRAPRPRAARSIRSPSERVTIMSASTRTIVSAGRACGAIPLRRFPGTSVGPPTSSASLARRSRWASVRPQSSTTIGSSWPSRRSELTSPTAPRKKRSSETV